MRKLLFGAVATIIVALQPTLALAQRSPSDFVKVTPSPTRPRVTEFGPFNILQTVPVSPTTAGLPTTVIPTGFCLVGTATGVREGSFQNIRFVGNVLCLDPGPTGDFSNWTLNCPAGTTPVIQGTKLIKTVPLVPKCPDVFPGGTFVQTPQSTGIRTWWLLKHSPCDTTFRLEIEFACVRGAGANRGQVAEVRVNAFTFVVSITADTLNWLIEALHNEPLGVCEVPCITDEGLFVLLGRQAATVAREAAAGPGRIRQLNDALDIMEATIVRNTIFLVSVAQVTRDAAGNITRINPCGAAFPAGPPGNSTIGAFGFGIVDTLENPCACKLIADIVCLKARLIGIDP